MDIERLRKILKELNPIFWNPKIDHQLQEQNCANHTPIQSSEKRYIIAIYDFGPDRDLSAFPKSGPYRQIIRAEKSPEKQLRDRLFQEFQDCLTPYDRVYDILRKEFPSSFAEQVLLTHENLIRNFSSISINNYKDWGQLMVCMSHKDFWTIPLAKGPGTNAELKPIEASTKAVIQQLSDWSKEYLSDGAQLEGKVAPEAPVKLIDIMDERTFGRLDDRLDQNNRQKKAGRIRAEYQKIIKWVQSGGNETFPQNDEESPFTHNGQQYYVKLIELLQEVLQDSEPQTFGQKPVESEPTEASGELKMTANSTSEILNEEPYHRIKNPSGAPLAKAVQMEVTLRSQFCEALQGIPEGKEYMLKLAEVIEGFADEKITDDLEYFCLNYPEPFSSRVFRLSQLADSLFWWMRKNALSGIADALERDLRQIANIARKLDASSPPPPGITIGPDARPEKLYARHVPLNADLKRFAHRLRDVASGGEKPAEMGKEKDGQGKKDDVPTLTEDKARVLNYLNGEYPQIRYQQDIASACDRDRKTIQACLKKLMESGFASRPEGKKKGCVITLDGKDYLNEYF